MSTPNNEFDNHDDEMVCQFMAVTECRDPVQATNYLELSGGDIEVAVVMFLEQWLPNQNDNVDTSGLESEQAIIPPQPHQEMKPQVEISPDDHSTDAESSEEGAEATQEALLSRFMGATGCPRSLEAARYLEMSDGDVELAVAIFLEQHHQESEVHNTTTTTNNNNNNNNETTYENHSTQDLKSSPKTTKPDPDGCLDFLADPNEDENALTICKEADPCKLRAAQDPEGDRECKRREEKNQDCEINQTSFLPFKEAGNAKTDYLLQDRVDVETGVQAGALDDLMGHLKQSPNISQVCGGDAEAQQASALEESEKCKGDRQQRQVDQLQQTTIVLLEERANAEAPVQASAHSESENHKIERQQRQVDQLKQTPKISHQYSADAEAHVQASVQEESQRRISERQQRQLDHLKQSPDILHNNSGVAEAHMKASVNKDSEKNETEGLQNQVGRLKQNPNFSNKNRFDAGAQVQASTHKESERRKSERQGRQQGFLKQTPDISHKASADVETHHVRYSLEESGKERQGKQGGHLLGTPNNSQGQWAGVEAHVQPRASEDSEGEIQKRQVDHLQLIPNISYKQMVDFDAHHLQWRVEKEDILWLLRCLGSAANSSRNLSNEQAAAFALMKFAKSNHQLRDEMVVLDAFEPLLVSFGSNSDEVEPFERGLTTMIAMTVSYLVCSPQSIIDFTPVKRRAIATCIDYLRPWVEDESRDIKLRNEAVLCSTEIVSAYCQGCTHFEDHLSQLAVHLTDLNLNNEPKWAMQYEEIRTGLMALNSNDPDDPSGIITPQCKYWLKWKQFRGPSEALALSSTTSQFKADVVVTLMKLWKKEFMLGYLTGATKEREGALSNLATIVCDESDRKIGVVAALAVAYMLPSLPERVRSHWVATHFSNNAEKPRDKACQAISSSLRALKSCSNNMNFDGLEISSEEIRLAVRLIMNENTLSEASTSQLVEVRTRISSLATNADIRTLRPYLNCTVLAVQIDVAVAFLEFAMTNDYLRDQILSLMGFPVFLSTYASTRSQELKVVIALTVAYLLRCDQTLSLTPSIEVWILDCMNFLRFFDSAINVNDVEISAQEVLDACKSGREHLANHKYKADQKKPEGRSDQDPRNMVTRGIRFSSPHIYNGFSNAGGLLKHYDLATLYFEQNVIGLIRLLRLDTCRTLDVALLLLNLAESRNEAIDSICANGGVDELLAAFHPKVEAMINISVSVAMILDLIIPLTQHIKEELEIRRGECRQFIKQHYGISRVLMSKAANKVCVDLSSIRLEPTTYDHIVFKEGCTFVQELVSLTSLGIFYEDKSASMKSYSCFWEDLEFVKASSTGSPAGFRLRLRDGSSVSLNFDSVRKLNLLIEDAQDRLQLFKKEHRSVENTEDGVTAPRVKTVIYADCPEFLGVSAYHLKNHFLAQVEATEGLSGQSKFYELENIHERSGYVRKQGEDQVCPMDGRMGCAYVHTLRGCDNVGPATHMLSWAWSYTVADVVDTIISFCRNHKYNPKRTYVWICCLCLNQHRIVESNKSGMLSSSVVDFEEEFRHRVLGIGRVMSMMTPWENPATLKRIWCIFELFMTLTTNCDLYVIMPPREEDRMMNQLLLCGKNGIESLYRALSAIEVESAEASVEQDKKRILDLILNKTDFQTVNTLVRARLRDWVQSGIKLLVNECAEMNEVHWNSPTVCENFADLAELNGDYEAAHDMRKRSSELRLFLVKGEGETKDAEAYFNMGQALFSQGIMKRAMLMFSKALKIQEESNLHLDAAKTYFEMGRLLEEGGGDRDEALSMMQKSLFIQETTPGGNPHDIARTHCRIGSLLCDKGEFKEGLQVTLKALALLEESVGKDHPDTALCFSTMAALLQPTDLEGALSMIDRCLSIQESVVGANHPDLAATFHRKGEILRRMGRLEESECNLNKALKIYEATSGEKELALVKTYANLSIVAHLRNDPDEGTRLHDEALSELARCLGDQKHICISIYRTAARELYDHGDFDHALLLFEQAEDATGMKQVALTYAKLCVEALAEKVTRLDGLRLQSKLIVSLRKCSNVGVTQEVMGIYRNARTRVGGKTSQLLLQQASHVLEEVLGNNHPDLTTCYASLGYCY